MTRFRDAAERVRENSHYIHDGVMYQPIIDAPLNDYAESTLPAYEEKKRKQFWYWLLWRAEEVCEKCKWFMLFGAIIALIITLLTVEADLFLKTHPLLTYHQGSY